MSVIAGDRNWRGWGGGGLGVTDGQSSIQDGIYALGKAHMPSEVSTTLPLKWFQCSSD